MMETRHLSDIGITSWFILLRANIGTLQCCDTQQPPVKNATSQAEHHIFLLVVGSLSSAQRPSPKYFPAVLTEQAHPHVRKINTKHLTKKIWFFSVLCSSRFLAILKPCYCYSHDCVASWQHQLNSYLSGSKKPWLCDTIFLYGSLSISSCKMLLFLIQALCSQWH